MKSLVDLGKLLPEIKCFNDSTPEICTAHFKEGMIPIVDTRRMPNGETGETCHACFLERTEKIQAIQLDRILLILATAATEGGEVIDQTVDPYLEGKKLHPQIAVDAAFRVAKQFAFDYIAGELQVPIEVREQDEKALRDASGFMPPDLNERSRQALDGLTSIEDLLNPMYASEEENEKAPEPDVAVPLGKD